MWFRILSIIVVIFVWVVTVWMATHRSENIEVFSYYSKSYFLLIVLLFVMSIAVTVLQFGSAYSWIYSKRVNLTLLVFSLIFSIGGIELLVRAFDPLGISYYKHAKNYHLDKVADDDLYYRHQSNLDQNYQGVSVKTNALGMRDEAITAKDPEELRIMFLGDSVTFGWGAKQEDIFVHRVEDILEKNLKQPVRTINTGVGSYNTHNEYAVLKRYGETIDPELVVLIYVGNDITPKPRKKFDPWTDESFQDKSPPNVFNMILGKSWTYRLVMHLKKYRRGASEAGLQQSSEGWKQSRDSLQNISVYCESHKIPLLVFMYRMVPTKLDNDIAQEIKEMSVKMNFYYEDVLPWFKGKDIHSLINSSVDSHHNADGHAVLAEGIAAALQQNIFLSRVRSE